MSLTTLADVRVFVEQHLPKPYRDRPHWLAVARDLEAAARGGDAAEASMALMPALRCSPNCRSAVGQRMISRPSRGSTTFASAIVN
jgi:hypothetical protein